MQPTENEAVLPPRELGRKPGLARAMTMVAVFCCCVLIRWEGSGDIRQYGRALAVTAEATASDLTGRWEGRWTSSQFAVTGTLTTLLAQAESTLSGEVTITGTGCLSHGTVSGTADGAAVVFGAVFGSNAQVCFLGMVRGDGAILEGTYEVSGGPCAGDRGTWHTVKIALPCEASGDGLIDGADALALFRFLRHGGEALAGYPDCNRDGVVDRRDVLAILRAMLR